MLPLHHSRGCNNKDKNREGKFCFRLPHDSRLIVLEIFTPLAAAASVIVLISGNRTVSI